MHSAAIALSHIRANIKFLISFASNPFLCNYFFKAKNVPPFKSITYFDIGDTNRPHIENAPQSTCRIVASHFYDQVTVKQFVCTIDISSIPIFDHVLLADNFALVCDCLISLKFSCCKVFGEYLEKYSGNKFIMNETVQISNQFR